jgi:hypothetical protein
MTAEKLINGEIEVIILSVSNASGIGDEPTLIVY